MQLSYLYLGAMKALSALLSCSKYAELLLIPKVGLTLAFQSQSSVCCHLTETTPFIDTLVFMDNL